MGAVDADPDTVLTEASQGAKQERPKIKGCADWLRSFLHDHAFPAKEIEQAANAKGFSKDDVNRAKALLKDHGLCNKKRGVGAWWSGFGDPKNWIYRPEPKED